MPPRSVSTVALALTLGRAVSRALPALSVLVLSSSLCAGTAAAKGTQPEDILKGQLIISDRTFPTNWTSAGAYASQIKGRNKGSLFYDKKTGKVTIYYAAFFAQPVNDVQVNFVVYDVTDGPRVRKNSSEAFLGRKGDRVLFNNSGLELDKEDYPMNRKYLLAIESAHKIIASGQVILRGEGPHYSGKVEFTDDELKNKKKEE